MKFLEYEILVIQFSVTKFLSCYLKVRNIQNFLLYHCSERFLQLKKNTNMLVCSHFFAGFFFLGSCKLYCFLTGANAMCHGEEGTYDFFHVF